MYLDKNTISTKSNFH